MKPVLSMKNITKSFFGTPANDNVNLEVFPGEIHALLGENGAGKTTLMNILYGIYTPDSGEILWKGEEVKFRSPKDAIDCKIGMVHQHFTLVSKLTVSENITLGLKTKGYPFTDRKALDAQLSAISERYGLAMNPRARISTLSVGEQQRVEIMKLLYRDVELLILDEPTAVLTPGETADFFRILKKLKDDGKSIIIITHRIQEVMEISDRVTVLRDARQVCCEKTEDLDANKLSGFMIGRELKHLERTLAPEETANPRETEGLKLENVSVREQKQLVLDDVSLSVRPGEIVGIAGVDGNGQKQLAQAIVGIQSNFKGMITLGGQLLDGLDVKKRKGLGIGYISDDRHKDGLIMNMNLCENMLLRSNRGAFVDKGFLREKTIVQETEAAVSKFSIKTHSMKMPIRLLSGGNQQKLILAREIHDGVKLIIAFQPTRGLDIGASEFIRQLLLQYRDQGCSVLLISADLEEIFSISDRVAVMHGGRIMGQMKNDENVDMTKVGLLMAGVECSEEESR